MQCGKAQAQEVEGHAARGSKTNLAPRGAERVTNPQERLRGRLKQIRTFSW